MTKKTRTRKSTKTVPERGTDTAIDYRPLIRACRDAAECALDIAAESAGDFPGGVEAAERVRTFVQARLDGRSARVCVEDVMFTLGLLIGAIERDLEDLAPRVADVCDPRITCAFRPTSWLDQYLFHARTRA